MKEGYKVRPTFLLKEPSVGFDLLSSNRNALSWLTYIYAAELLLLDERLSSLLINYMANYYTELFLSRTNIVVRAKY